jgi:HEPN domain-containing protein
MKEETERWIEKSENDLEHGESSMKLEHYDWAQLAAQQSAEKALKAVLIEKGIGLIKTHDLVMLARKSNAPKEILEKAAMLNSFYKPSRYPDVEIFLEETELISAAKEGLESASLILKWCKQQIKI